MSGILPSLNDASKVSLRLTQLGSEKQYFTYRGETYLIQAFRKSSVPGTPAEDITPLRDWKDAGKIALQTAETLFEQAKQSDEFAQLRTLHVPLEGSIAMSPHDRTDPQGVKLSSTIWYSRSITDNPEKCLFLTPEKLSLVQDKIEEIGVEAAQWKDPCRIAQQLKSPESKKQQSTSSSSSTPPQGSPSPAPSSQPALPPLSFKPSPLSQPKAEENLDQFLRNRIGDPLKMTKKNPAEIIAPQLKSFNPPVTKTGAELLDEFKQYFKEDAFNPNQPFAITPGDEKEIFQYMTEHVVDSSIDLLKGDLTADEILGLKNLLNQTKEPVIESEKKLLIKAFGMYCCSTDDLPGKIPSAFYQAILAIINRTPKKGWKTLISGRSYHYEGRKQIVLLTEKDGQYQIDRQWPAHGAINPSKTLFLLKTDAGYQGFDRKVLNIFTQDPSLPPHAERTVRTRPAYLSKEFSYDVGSKGDCAAKAIAAATFEKEGAYYEQQDAWQSAIDEKGRLVRRETMQYIFEHPELFIEEPYFSHFINAFLEAGKNGMISCIRSKEIRDRIEALFDQSGEPKREEKKWMVQLYALLAAEEGIWLDKPFFSAYALKNNQPIALIQPRAPEVVTFASSKRLIDEKDYLFIYYNGRDHFTPINRKHADLSGYIARYNQENLYLTSRSEFLQVLDRVTRPSGSLVISKEDAEELQQKLIKLKAFDLHGYLTLKSLVDDNALNGLESGNDIPAFLDGLTKGLEQVQPSSESIAVKLTAHFNRRTDLKARTEFFKALSMGKDRADLDLKRHLEELWQSDQEGYLVLESYFREDAPSVSMLNEKIKGCPDKDDLLSYFVNTLYPVNIP